jgi:CDP-paratose 2-epimerase
MTILITGGAGFIGTNLADALLRDGMHVTLYDNLSRRGSGDNVVWLQQRHGERVRFIQGDVRDAEAMNHAVLDAEVIYHLASQVAVTTSVQNPREDFEINALGTVNMLEAARASGANPIILYASTNKVYGGLEDLQIVEDATRYRYADKPHGVPETQPLDFHSPYGNSKGAGDQYTRDYARIYGMRTVVFRQSCIYGPRQFGIEDQGWLAHMCIAARLGRTIHIYGDGKQVRDVLYVDDLVRAFRLATEQIEVTRGRIYNIGGGPVNTLSIWAEFAPILERLAGQKARVTHAPWRPGDQRVYVSDIRKAQAEFGWSPQISAEAGIERLWRWVDEHAGLFM